MDADEETGTPRPTLGAEHGRFIKRVDELKGTRGLAAYAKALGVSEGLLRRLYDGGETTRPVLVAMAKDGNCTLDWLVLGIEPKSWDWPREGGKTPIDSLMEFVTIPRYDVKAAAGHGATVDDEKLLPPLAFRADWLISEGWSIPDLEIITATGDSMSGVVEGGRPVMIDRSQTSISGGAVYVARLDNELIIKRMQRVGSGSIQLISTNRDYPDVVINPEKEPGFAIIGRAVWSDRKL